MKPVAIERDQAQIGAVTARDTARFYSGGVSEKVRTFTSQINREKVDFTPDRYLWGAEGVL
mgnify:CR=1 FL=1